MSALFLLTSKPDELDLFVIRCGLDVNFFMISSLLFHAALAGN